MAISHESVAGFSQENEVQGTVNPEVDHAQEDMQKIYDAVSHVIEENGLSAGVRELIRLKGWDKPTE